MAHEIQHILSGESPVKHGTFIHTIIGYLKRSHSTNTMAKEDKQFKKEETAYFKSIIETHDCWERLDVTNHVRAIPITFSFLLKVRTTN